MGRGAGAGRGIARPWRRWVLDLLGRLGFGGVCGILDLRWCLPLPTAERRRGLELEVSLQRGRFWALPTHASRRAVQNGRFRKYVYNFEDFRRLRCMYRHV